MTKLLLYLLLTPQSNLPYIDAVPLDWHGCNIRGDWTCKKRIVEGYPFLALRVSRCQCEDNWWEMREATRLFLYEQIAEGTDPKEILYLLGRMQGRQILWQRNPKYPFSFGWLDVTQPMEEHR